MAIGITDIAETLIQGPGGLGDELFGSAGNDPTLGTALPAEAELRNKLNFANIRVAFPTSGGQSPLANVLTLNALSFPAYIASYSDNFSIGFTQNSVYGRTDPIPSYNGTTRTVSLGLKIPCFDAADANENLKKINTFIKNIYPSYNKIKQDLIIGSPPLVRIKFANLIADHRFTFKGLLGYITTFTFNPDITNGFYFSKSSEGTNNLFFRSYTISFTMTVLHESVIGFVNGEFNSKTDYPYRTENSFFNPIQRPSPSELKSRFGISGDLSEAKILS